MICVGNDCLRKARRAFDDELQLSEDILGSLVVIGVLCVHLCEILSAVVFALMFDL